MTPLQEYRPPRMIVQPILMVFFACCVDLACLQESQLPSSDGRRLYETLTKDYNKLIRPVEEDSKAVLVLFSVKLSQLIDVDEVDQVVHSNVWIRQQWNDYRMRWDPAEYGGMKRIQILSDMLWTPDIVLYNNADGNYEIVEKTRANIDYNGTIVWEPPAFYKSYCLIEVLHFPYDNQTCNLKFGTWSYDSAKINLMPLRGYVDDNTTMHNAIDLSEFYFSIEWDVLDVTARRNITKYECCEELYIDITYTFEIRRKRTFFTVNMIIPCAAISFLTVLVFFLPSDSGEKITLSISVLMSLTVFFLLLTEYVPPTSLAVPLIGKYLVFTMVLVTMSTMISVAVLDINFSNPSTHYKMSPWMRRIFIDILPPIIRVSRPTQHAPKYQHKSRLQKEREKFLKRSQYSTTTMDSLDEHTLGAYTYDDHTVFPEDGNRGWVLENHYSPEVERAIESVKFIADRFRESKENENMMQDWKYVARVIDRFFLLTFGAGCIFGTFVIILSSPSLYDDRIAIPFARCSNSTDFSKVPGYKPGEEELLRALLCVRDY